MRIWVLLSLLPSLALADTTAPPRGPDVIEAAPINFAVNKPTLLPDSDAALAKVKQLLDARPEITKLRIEVHTDSRGNDDYNQKMSEQRALAVARALVERGVACKRLLPVGFGETKPLDPGATPAAWAKNRRTTFAIVELRGAAFGNLSLDGGGRVAGDPCTP